MLTTKNEEQCSITDSKGSVLREY